jgi:glycosyltransferase involved in cell wall biosynthesis
MKKRILLITYYWPPTGGAGVIRWLMFSKYLSKEKYELIVYTPQNPEAQSIDQSFLKHIDPGITVCKNQIWEPYQLFKKATGKKDNFNAGFLNEEKPTSPGIVTKLSMFIRANFFIPDAKMLWIKPSVKFLGKLITEKKIDLVISTGPPHSLHIIARNLKRKFSTKWIADFRDPWTNIDFIKDLPMTKIAQNIQEKLELSVLKEADKVMIVGEQWRNDLCQIFNRDIELLSNGYEISFPEEIKPNKKFSILHVGNINADRTHESFFQALAKIISETPDFKNQFVLQYVGKVDIKTREFIEKYGLEELTEIQKYVQHDEIGQYLKQAHLLYLPINRTHNANGILTGKFYEYLAAQRPIIAQGLVSSEMDSVINATKSGALYDFDDQEGIKNAIIKWFNTFIQKGNFDLQNNIEDYSRKNLTQKLEKIIDQTLNQ